MDNINWNLPKEDVDIINKICERGVKLLKKHGAYRKDLFLTSMMDITAVHANGNPLRLQEFLDADNFNFAHDFCGIINHIDRNTGKLKLFLPRFSQSQK
jgi:hypothetical protein